MNTRSRTRSESGYEEYERPPPTTSALHRVFEDSPGSPSTAVTPQTRGIPQGRRLERSPIRASPGNMAPPMTPARRIVATTGIAGEAQEREGMNRSPSPRSKRHHSPPAHRPASPARSERTVRSNQSSVGAAARMKQAEYEAERELAALEERKIQLKQALVKKRLEAEISAIEAENAGSSINDQHHRVTEWIDQSHHDQPSRPKETERVQPPIDIRGEDNTRRRGIEQLATTLERMLQSRPPPRQTTELPLFSGAVMEWLPFRAAMEDSTRLYKFSATENLLRLRNSLRGEARDTVLSQLYTSAHPDSIMRTLAMKYGRPEYIIDRAMEELKRLPRVGNSGSDLNDFALRLQNIVWTMKSVDQRGYLQNPMLTRDVIEKLSPHIVSKWAEYAGANEHRIQQDSEITVLSEFLMLEADRVLRYTHTARHGQQGPRVNERPTRKAPMRERVYTANEESAPAEERLIDCLKCEATNHSTPDCPRFKKMTINERWGWAKENRICFRCMKKKHNRATCRAKPCGIQGCKLPHHAILHKAPRPAEPSNQPEEATKSPAAVMNVTAQTRPGAVLLKTCKVKLSGPRGEVVADALLDEGSTITLIDEDLAMRIATEGNKQPLNIKGVNEQKKINSMAVAITIQGLHEQQAHRIKARTVHGLRLHRQRVPTDINKYPHLRGIAHRVTTDEARPQLLIGADHWHLIVSRQLRSGKKNEPAASLTKLGWVIHGSVPNRVVMCDNEAVLHIYTQHGDTQMEKLIESHYAVDSLGITTKTRVSERDQRAERIFKETVRREGTQYEVGLPWKSDTSTLPDSYEQAFRRLQSIERKMKKEPTFEQQYREQVTNLIQKGYAVRCDGSEKTSQRQWFLPHFAVINLNKPGRVRMVFDAAAKTQGVSLNDHLLEGPDLLASLTHILFGFRQRKIAVTADIEEMFLRIKIRTEDQAAQMFLWRDAASEAPQHWKMTSMIFGASSSPYLAHSVRNYNATEHAHAYPEAAEAIQRRHYMDDYLDSYDTPEEAANRIKEIIYIHRAANFNLRGWNSNCESTLATIPEEMRSKNASVRLTAHQPEKTLGLRWNPSTDTLGFNTDIKRVPTEVKEGHRPPTKREALSAVMSIYDPLGLLSPYTIIGKIILQQLWIKKTGWDEELPAEDAREFRAWIKRLHDVSRLAIPRCYSANMSAGSTIQLHIFSDASERAYATAAYWRVDHGAGRVETIQIMAKAKVAPLKPLTVPRLELQAALIGARIANTILSEHTWRPEKITYWTDSRTVLQWIRNDGKRYTPFVAHRLAEITELSPLTSWRWVPTTDNPADDATRTHTGDLTEDHRWLIGPPFLRYPEAEWPTEDRTSENTEDTACFATTASDTDVAATLPPLERFSNYQKLIRATAFVRLFALKLATKNKALTLNVELIERAERAWIQRSQAESFKEEIERLTAGQPVHRHSRLARLDPTLDNGLIKARGRIGAATTKLHTNRPTILDGRHAFVRLLIAQYHRRAAHANNERVVNELRQEYLILHLRPTVRKVARECQRCRVYRAAPSTPPKGDLPRVRIEPTHRAFSHSGVDYFGPLNVAIGRRREKRWCALFTCLTTRAVHLELVASLSTDSAIMALRRMAARRGWPRVLYSDNATNFKGADVELKRAYAAWLPALREYGLTYKMDWRYIPPGAPHMGGAWERLVRSVKNALSATLNEKAPKEEVLWTLLTEAEHCVNARPLTHVSVDPADDEALTPNHFLIGSSAGLPATGPCEEADRSTWRKAQALADQFWHRWVREYLPTLIPRGQAATRAAPLHVGDLVVVVDHALPRNTWPRGIVEKTHPGPDGVVRSADIRTRGGVFRRPVTKLAVLEREGGCETLRRGENVADG